MNKKLYFGDPNENGKFHIFEDNKSLCGKWAMLFKLFDDEDLVKGTETRGENDCNPCFIKLEKIKNES